MCDSNNIFALILSPSMLSEIVSHNILQLTNLFIRIVQEQMALQTISPYQHFFLSQAGQQAINLAYFHYK